MRLSAGGFEVAVGLVVAVEGPQHEHADEQGEHGAVHVAADVVRDAEVVVLATRHEGVFEAMDAAVPVALTTRCASGAVSPLYGFPGGGRSWQEAGAIMAGTLSGPKARVALALGLGAGLDRAGLGELLGELLGSPSIDG